MSGDARPALDLDYGIPSTVTVWSSTAVWRSWRSAISPILILALMGVSVGGDSAAAQQHEINAGPAEWLSPPARGVVPFNGVFH